MKAYNYNYYTINIGEGGDDAYQAIIPKFPGMLVFGDTPKELHEGVMFGIEDIIKSYKKEGKSIPSPDIKPKESFKGKIMIRTAPELHEKLFYEAKAHGKSLNRYINDKLSKN